MTTTPTEKWTFDRYQIFQIEDRQAWELGESAFCRTYKGWDARLERPVFLHMLKEECAGIPALVTFFAGSSRALSGVANSRVAAVRDLLPEEDPRICVTEYFDGEPLDAFMARAGRLDVGVVLELGLQGAKILRCLWEARLVLVDFRPSLLLLCHEGEEPLLRLWNGLVSTVSGEGEGNRVRLPIEIPLEPYFSPEQRDGGGYDIRANVFSLGMLMYQWFTGAPVPRPDETLSFQALRGMPHAIIDVTTKMLEPAPENRFQNPAELIWALEHCRSGGKVTRAPEIRPAEASVHVTGGARFKAIEALDDAERFVEAQDLRDGGRVLLHRLGAELSAKDREEIRVATVLRAYPERHIARPLEIVESGDAPFIAYEWLHGFSLLDVLQKRRRIPFEEGLGFLEAIATALDHAALRGVPNLDYSLTGIRFHFEGIWSRDHLVSLAGTSSSGWPAYSIKLAPLAAARGYSRQRAAEPAKEAGSAIKAFGKVACQLLGGKVPGSQYSPIAGLPEAVNAILANCLRPGAPGFSQAREMVSEIRVASGQLTVAAASAEFSGPYADSVPVVRAR